MPQAGQPGYPPSPRPPSTPQTPQPPPVPTSQPMQTNQQRSQQPNQQCGQQPAGAPKQNKVTTMPKPIGIDPIQLLNERENRLARAECLFLYFCVHVLYCYFFLVLLLELRLEWIFSIVLQLRCLKISGFKLKLN